MRNHIECPIRIANAADEPEILTLLKKMHSEGGWQPLNIDRARETFAKAFDRKGGILAVIGPPGNIRAMMLLIIAKAWFTDHDHLQEYFCYVHPDHRKSDYHKILIEYAKTCSDELSKDAGYKFPLFMGVMTSKRMASKVRLYRRFFGIPVGAYFMHNASWVDKTDLSEEDVWRIPKIASLLFRSVDRVERDKYRQKAQG